MAKENVFVVAENGNDVQVMIGANQTSFVDGDVWRFPAELYADISAYSGVSVNGVTPTDTSRYFNTLDVLLKAFNEKHNCELKASDYDVARGRYNKAELRHAQQMPVVKTVAPVVATAVNSPVLAVADKTDATNVWIGEQFQAGKSEEEIIASLKSQKWTDAQLKPYFKSMQEVAPVGIPPPPPN